MFGFSSPNGNNIHIDDDETNEIIRLRTKSGVQLLLHETTGYIYMISKKGNSWMEISDEGINMYSRGSINMRAEGGINSHTEGEHRAQAKDHHARATNNSTVASEGNHTQETKGDRSTTTDGKDSKNAGEHTRNSDKITDAKGPEKSSLSKEKTPDQATKKTSTPGDNNKTKYGPDHRNDKNGLSNGATDLLGRVENKFGGQYVTAGNNGEHGQTSDHNWNLKGTASDAVDLRTWNMSGSQQQQIVN
ncbi:MAG: hypothetical protein EOO77_37740, partial [Oxalobacteraceae bacterium]